MRYAKGDFLGKYSKMELLQIQIENYVRNLETYLRQKLCFKFDCLEVKFGKRRRKNAD